MMANAQLQVRRPAAAARTARQQARAMQTEHARAAELQHGVVSSALNASTTVQRLTRIQARANTRRPAAQASPIQRTFHVGRMSEGINLLSQKAQDNWDNASKYLGLIGQAVEPEVNLLLQNAEMRGTNPAETRYTPAATEDDRAEIDITIANWYLEMASTGEMLGMLTHELGVHSLANAEMSDEQRQAETLADPEAAVVSTGTRDYPLAGRIENDKRQKDHVNAVKVQAEGQLRARGQRYLATFLRMGDAIENDPALTLLPAEKARRQRDLLDTFLFDIGRIVATDDGGAIRKLGKAGVPFTTVLASSAIADVMNWYRSTFLRPQYEDHDWLEQFDDDAVSGGKVAGMLINKLADYGVANVKTASTTTKGLLGAAGVGAVAAGLAFAPLTTLALGGAGLAYGAYRYFTG